MEPTCSRATPGCLVTEACSTPLRAGVVLSPREQCWVDLLSSRCNVYDKCIVDCLKDGRGKDVGGGCWHSCAYVFSGGVQCPAAPPVPGWERCDTLSN